MLPCPCQIRPYTTIFYCKTPEYLRTYYNSWSELRKREKTIAVHFEVVQAMRQTLTLSTRQRTAPPAIVPAVMTFPQSAIQTQIIPLILYPTSLDQRASQPVIAPLPTGMDRQLPPRISSSSRQRTCKVCSSKQCPGRGGRFLLNVPR